VDILNERGMAKSPSKDSKSVRETSGSERGPGDAIQTSLDDLYQRSKPVDVKEEDELLHEISR
jgi:hypothetical protein